MLRVFFAMENIPSDKFDRMGSYSDENDSDKLLFCRRIDMKPKNALDSDL